MNIILSGYGKMGHELEQIAIERGHSIIGIFDNEQDWNEKQIPDGDVVIDFSTSQNVANNIRKCFAKNIPVVSGTTGWNQQLKELKETAIKEEKSFFYASNFSIGVNIFFQINKTLASFLCSLEQYDLNIHEIHHIHKKDAPSGTAITLAEDIISECSRYNSWIMDDEAEGKIRITSERIGEVPGTHTINWHSAEDSIQITHTAKSRKGFALGAIIAAEWIIGRKGVFGMKDLIQDRV